MNTLRFCSMETDTNFIFCNHASEKCGLQIKLVITDSKEAEGDQQIINVNHCPFCGFTEEM